MKKQVIKVKRPKRRIPVAPPMKKHKSDKDYDRKKSDDELRELYCPVCGRPNDPCDCDM